MQIAIGLYPGFTALDFVGPYQVLTYVPGAEIVLCAERTGRVTDDRGTLHVDVEHTFADVPSPDILLVPGGPGSTEASAPGSAVVEWVRRAHETTTWTASVCTGAEVLGAAGLLDGGRATTHWLYCDVIEGHGAKPTQERVVFEGKVVTGAGVSAGIDLAFTLVAREFGQDLAESIQLGIEYDPQPPFDAGAPSKAKPEIKALVTAVMRPGYVPTGS